MRTGMLKVSLLSCLWAFILCAQSTEQQTAAATLTLSGDLPATLVLKADDLSKMPRETVSVQDQDGTKVEYEGVLLREILKRAGAPMDKQLRGKALATKSSSP